MEDSIKKRLQDAERLVEESGIADEFKPAAFTLVFSLLSDDSLPPRTIKKGIPAASQTPANHEVLEKIADFTGFEVSQLGEIFYQNDAGEIRLRNIPLDLVGKTRRERQRGLASVFLLAKKLEGTERVKGLEVAKLMKDRGIMDGNLNMIARGPDRVATADGKGKGLHYQLSSSGEKEAKKVIANSIQTR